MRNIWWLYTLYTLKWHAGVLGDILIERGEEWEGFGISISMIKLLGITKTL